MEATQWKTALGPGESGGLRLRRSCKGMEHPRPYEGVKLWEYLLAWEVHDTTRIKHSKVVDSADPARKKNKLIKTHILLKFIIFF